MNQPVRSARPRRSPDPEYGRAVRDTYERDAPRAPEGRVELLELFPATAEIEMEIGFGRGQFLLQRAAAAPDAHLLGVELKKKLAYKVEQRRARLGLSRVRVMAADVRELLPRLSPDAALARAFVNFPDPWWKKRHAKRRVLSEDLLDELARLLRPGGELFVQTDVEERALTLREQLDEHPAFLREAELADHPYGARSNREQSAIDSGLPIYRLLAKRI
jgi:tRNA (guanine-N7-)-methyltransferase